VPVIPAFGKLRQEDPEFQASLGHIARSYLKYTHKQQQQNNKTFAFSLYLPVLKIIIF
jgi:hypothetical protein